MNSNKDYENLIIPDKNGKRIDLSNRELIWHDEFDGDTVDTSKWVVFDRKGMEYEYYTPDQVTVKDGCAYLRVEYHKNGKWGDGFYAGWLSTQDSFRNTYGYYEIRCKMPKAEGVHAAFWTSDENMYDYKKTAKFASEIDVFENANRRVAREDEKLNSTFHITVHGGDGEGNHVMNNTPQISTLEEDGTDMYNTFHTYGLEWTKKEYIFYYDGIEVARFDFTNGPLKGTVGTLDGICEVPMLLYVSTHVGTAILDDGSIKSNWNGNAFNNPSGTFPTDFIVDYVRVYAPLE